MEIAIVGAGIGGLTLAAGLSSDGHDVTVFERAGDLGEVGAGIQLSPNGTRVLLGLGLEVGLRTIGTAAQRSVFRRWEDDREIAGSELGGIAESRWGAPFFSVYRPDIIQLLSSACGQVDFFFDAQVVSVAEVGDQVAVQLTESDEHLFDLVVGADGIHSAVRSSLWGEQPARFSGVVAYRALVPFEFASDLPVDFTVRLGPGGHVVSYFIGKDQRYLNLVALADDRSWELESWTEPVAASVLQEQFSAWSPTVRRLLGAVEDSVFRWALYDREPLPTWGKGRVTLLGDACHPMVPFMAQGACQAIEDADVLRQCLARQGTLVDALQRYEEARRDRTALVQTMSMANATTFHLPDGDLQRERDEFLNLVAKTEPGLAANFDWLYNPRDDLKA
ncbi:MAG: FAD-dependent monooxygenase [Actinomycetes bacterium]